MTARTLIKVLRLPFDSVRTVYVGPSEVRLYRNQITDVLQIGKRVSAIGKEEAAVFREAKVLQVINHDSIVPVHDVAVVEGDNGDASIKVIEMIMPFYERGSVFDALLRGERFSVAAAVQLAREALAGLSVLHDSHRLLHRDMKSPNVFLDNKGRARVGDLGAAIPMRDDGTAEAFASQQVYTAPEVHVTKTCDRRTDIYGAGLVLFELLNGPFPYGDYTPPAIWRKLQNGYRPISPSHLVFQPHICPRLRQIVTKAIAKAPNDRFSDARQMIDALNAAPLIDWHVKSDADGCRIVEGASANQPTKAYRVVLRRTRRKDWKLSGFKHVTRWQRCVEDQVVDDPAGAGATAFFDQLLKQACSC